MNLEEAVQRYGRDEGPAWAEFFQKTSSAAATPIDHSSSSSAARPQQRELRP